MQENNTDFIHFSDRSDDLAKHLNLNAKELAEFIGISRPMLYAYKTGRSPITGKVWRKLAQAEEKAGIRLSTKTDVENHESSETLQTAIESLKMLPPEQREQVECAIVQIIKALSPGIFETAEKILHNQNKQQEYSSIVQNKSKRLKELEEKLKEKDPNKRI
ncbi:MAG: helix-turn-helix transcriptional regulator [Opitutales bacterium]|nr:helix-turn-helix transcriptional regulator [Opitutales bacterium]